MNSVERQIVDIAGHRGLTLMRELCRRAHYWRQAGRSVRVVYGWFQAPTRAGNPHMGDELACSGRTVRRTIEALRYAEVRLDGHVHPVPLFVTSRPPTPGFPSPGTPHPKKPLQYRIRCAVIRAISRAGKRVGKRRAGPYKGHERPNRTLTGTGPGAGGARHQGVSSAAAAPRGNDTTSDARRASGDPSVMDRIRAIVARTTEAASRQGRDAEGVR